MDRCNFTVKQKLTDTVAFGKDHRGKSVIIKTVSTAGPENGSVAMYIDTHCRLHHPNLVGGSVLVPGVCQIDSIILLLEPCLYSLADFITSHQKSDLYYQKADLFANGLVRGLSYLHQNNVSHNLINTSNCLVKDDETACLSDFKLSSDCTDMSISRDNQKLGRCLLEMYTMTIGSVNSTATTGSLLQRYKSVFKGKLPYEELIYGRSYLFPHETVLSPSSSSEKPKISLKTIFCQIMQKLTYETDLRLVFAYLHNLYRMSEIALVTCETVMAFTDYAYGITTQPSQDVLNWIFRFNGSLRPNTVYDFCETIEDVFQFGQEIFKPSVYLRTYPYRRPSGLVMTLGDIDETLLGDMFDSPEDFLA